VYAWSCGDRIKTRKARNLCPRKIFIPLSTQTPSYTFLPTMTTPSNTSPTAVAHHDAVISAFNNYKYSRDSKDPSDVPFLLSLAAKYCMHVSFTSYLFLCSRGNLIPEPGESHQHEGSCPTHTSTDAQHSFPHPEQVQCPYQSNTWHGHSLWLPSCHQLLL